MSRMLFKTDEAQHQNDMPMPHELWYENHLRVKVRSNMDNMQLTRYQSPLLVPKEEAAELKTRLLYTMIGVKDFGDMRDQAAAATAQLALSFGLNPFNGEIYPIPQKSKGGVVGFTVYVGYKGLHRAAREVARHELNTDFIFGAAQVLGPDEVEKRGAHRCFRCGGSGKFGESGKCFKCGGQAGFPPDEVIVVRISVALFSKVQMAKALNMEFVPTWGVGVWQPGDNIPEGRDPEWVATKRAKADALRQEFDLPFSYGERDNGEVEPGPQVITISHPEMHPAVEAARLAGITYDDEAAFIAAVEDALRMGYESPGHVIEALLDMEHTHLSVDDLVVADSFFEHWLDQEREAQIDQEPGQDQLL